MSEIIKTKTNIVDGFGSIILPFDEKELFNKGYAFGDVLKVNINGKDYIMPFTDVFGKVGFGEDTICINEGEGNLCVNKNMVGFVNSYNLAIKSVKGLEVSWQIIDKEFDISISMYQEKGYFQKLNEYASNDYAIINDRDFYVNLDDEAFANFRVLDVGKHNVYRGCAPYDISTGRKDITESLVLKYNIKTIVSLGNKEINETNYKGSSDSIYFQINHNNFLFELNPIASTTLNALKEIVLYINNNEGPYYIHCTYGRDRTGILCAFIEALLGVDLKQIVNDYKQSFCNLFNIELENSFNTSITSNVFYPVLQYAFDTKDVENINLKQASYNYLLKTGLSKKDIDTFIQKLS